MSTQHYMAQLEPPSQKKTNIKDLWSLCALWDTGCEVVFKFIVCDNLWMTKIVYVIAREYFLVQHRKCIKIKA